jgi:hypothetical protein
VFEGVQAAENLFVRVLQIFDLALQRTKCFGAINCEPGCLRVDLALYFPSRLHIPSCQASDDSLRSRSASAGEPSTAPDRGRRKGHPMTVQPVGASHRRLDCRPVRSGLIGANRLIDLTGRRSEPVLEVFAGNYLSRNSDLGALCWLITHLDEAICVGNVLAPPGVGNGYRVGMFASRRFALIGAAGTAVWYVCILAFWALQPLSDSVPVGVDYSGATPVNVSVSVDCNTLFNSAPRPDDPLPPLTVQPEGKLALGFQRDPCVLVHDQARIVFVLDTVVFLGVLGCLVGLTVRRRRIEENRPGPEPSLVGSPAG